MENKVWPVQPQKSLRFKPLAELCVDHGERPKMPALDGVTDEHKKAGTHLAAIHRMHLRDMNYIGQLIENVKSGGASAAALAEKISTVELTENMRQFVTLCGRECRVLNFHHGAEEQMIFPQLEQQGIIDLSLIVARLKEEHLVVHELLNRLQDAANQLVAEQTVKNFFTTEASFLQLLKVVKSHFGYEETELGDALGKFVPVI